MLLSSMRACADMSSPTGAEPSCSGPWCTSGWAWTSSGSGLTAVCASQTLSKPRMPNVQQVRLKASKIWRVASECRTGCISNGSCPAATFFRGPASLLVRLDFDVFLLKDPTRAVLGESQRRPLQPRPAAAEQGMGSLPTT